MTECFKDPAFDASESDALKGQTQRRASNEINAQLTPGLIHEVNNILTGIYFNLEGCRDFLGTGHPLAETVQEIQVGVERIKEVLGRVTQIYLNAAEREVTYHDAQEIVTSQLDLLRTIFPKTARIILSSPENPLHIRVSEYSFRVGLLTLAVCLKDFYPQGKTEIPLSVLSPEDLSSANITEPPILEEHVGISFRLPCVALSVLEIDDFHSRESFSDLSMAAAEDLIVHAGGKLLFFKGKNQHSSEVVIAFPRFNLNS
jgi:hypothetical protein